MNYRGIGLKIVVGLIACTGTALAHHSTAEFDYSKNRSITGTVVELQWMNPHSFIEILVPDSGPDGGEQRWSIEIGSPNINTRMGWKRTTVKAGDRVSMEIAPTRDGRPRGTLRVMTLPNGQQIKGIAGLTISDKNGAPLINPNAVSTGAPADKSGDKK